MRNTLLHGLILLFWTGAAAADCEGGSPPEQLQCLQQQQCPDAVSDAELASCYRSISLELLSQQESPAARLADVAQEKPAAADSVPADASAPDAAEPAAALAASTRSPTVNAPTPTAAAAAATTAASTPSQATENDFGLPPTPVEKVEPEAISAVIVRVKKQPRGNYLIALDNGQLWQENEPSRSYLRKGQQVRIVKGQLNSYKLIPEKARSTGVNRIPCSGSQPDPRCALLDS